MTDTDSKENICDNINDNADNSDNNTNNNQYPDIEFDKSGFHYKIKYREKGLLDIEIYHYKDLLFWNITIIDGLGEVNVSVPGIPVSVANIKITLTSEFIWELFKNYTISANGPIIC